MIARALLLALFSLGGTAAASAARALAEGGAFSTDIAPPELSPGELAGRIIGAVVLLCFSALFSGLTLGLEFGSAATGAQAGGGGIGAATRINQPIPAP